MAKYMDVVVRFRTDSRAAKAEIDRVEGAAVGAAGRSTTAFNRLAGAIVAAFSVRAVAQFSAQLVQTSRELDSMRRKLEVAFPNEGHAGFNRALDFANKYGLALSSVTEGYVRFAAAVRGSDLEHQTDSIFESILRVGSALRLPTERLNGLVLAFEQMVSKGVVSMEELRRQLGDRLPGAFRLAAQSMGLTTAELDKLVREGKVFADELLPLLADAIDRKFGPAAESAALGIDAAIHRFQTQWDLTLETFFKNVAEDAFKYGLDASTEWLKGFSKNIEERGFRYAGGAAVAEGAAALTGGFDVGKAIDDSIEAFSNFSGGLIDYFKGQTPAQIEESKRQVILGLQSHLGGSAFFPKELPPPPPPDQLALRRGDEAFLTEVEKSVRTDIEKRQDALDESIEKLQDIIDRGGEGVDRALAGQIALREKHTAYEEELNEKQRKRDEREQSRLDRLVERERQRQERLVTTAQDFRARYDDEYAAELEQDRALDFLNRNAARFNAESYEKTRVAIVAAFDEAIKEARLTDFQRSARELVTNFRDAATDAIVSGNFDNFGQAVFQALQASLLELAFDQLGNLLKQKFPELAATFGFARGGLVGGTGAQTATVHAGELILNRAQQGVIAGDLTGGSGVVINNSPQFSMIGSVDAATANFFAQNERRLARSIANTVRQARIGR